MTLLRSSSPGPRPLACALFPALLAACPGTPSETTATDPTGSTSGTDPTLSPPTTTASTETEGSTTGGDTTTQEPTTTTQGTTGMTSADTTTSSSSDSTGMAGECVPGDTRPCYSGPARTDGVGNCVAGEQQCDRDGTWGPCEGEVVPTRETCDEPGDEDCDGDDPCLGDGAFDWGLTFGKNGNDEGQRLAFDAAGNLVLAVWGDGPIDFGDGTLQNAGNDVFLAKFSPTGALLWSKRYGDASFQGGPDYGLAVTPAGDIVLAGAFNGEIDFGGGPLNNPLLSTDLFLVTLNGDGGHVWSTSFHSANHADVADLALAANGDILLTGTFGSVLGWSTLDLGDGELASKGLYDIFVARLTSTGAHVWSQSIGDPDFQHGRSIAVDAAGNAYVTGWFSGTIDPGSGPLISAGSDDIFLFKLDPAGNAVWGKRFGDAGSQSARGVTVDGQGRVTIAGANTGAVDFGGGVLDGPKGLSYLAQFDGDGAHLWSKKLCVDHSIAHDVATDGLGNILVTGEFRVKCDLGGAPLIAVDDSDVFVGKFTPKGQHGWSRGLGGEADQFSTAIAGSTAGSVAVTGNFSGAIDLGDGSKANQGGRDGFVVVFDP
ncbi:hypothetical protein [Nannocystis sp. SCPEA4]|uniref:hypothetical protein n=1 Tax=Nannocystis sp. SCPEA4 TaxID=2996787 RepID=UPI0022706F02|nr:hypothetical protein [Nannocystis sp. SCPEA4]MCY1062170.1 hypothetical protein [Nannocystis sp. SCPEA4]